MSRLISTYKVGVSRGRKGAPVRWLDLDLAAPEERIRRVSLFFYDEMPRSRGFRNSQTGTIMANLPVADFDPTYHILQTEKPVFVHWRTDDDDAVISIDVSTTEEPLGEGMTDGT
jgi:hypothetical protein